jgi:MSHA biogenesis protein MshP
MQYTLITSLKAKQQGSALMLALFIIIVLTLLGTTLVKVLSTSSEAIAQEVLGTRALMAAKSAMQVELQLLFPLDTLAPNYCAVDIIDKQHNLQMASGEDIPGLYNCTAQTSCRLYFVDINTGINYYRLTSTGECGSGTITADSTGIVQSSRTIQVEARSL